MILVVCALREELQFFSARAGVEVIESGVGAVEAAATTARALQNRCYRAVLNVGLGGAFSRERANGNAGRPDVALRIGDAVLVTRETLADFGLEGGGSPALPRGMMLVGEVQADHELVSSCSSAPVRSGPGLTVTTVTTTDATAARLHARYGAEVESMEGFAVLRAAELAGVPALEIRGISNYVGDRTRAHWDFSAGARAVAAALELVLERLRKL